MQRLGSLWARRGLLFIAFVAVAAVASPPAQSGGALVTTQMQTFTWYATATSSSGGAALSPAPSTNGVTSYAPPSKNLASGASDTTARYQGRDVSPVEFESAPLNSTIWLNLTLNPEVTLWWSWTGARGTYPNDELRIRIELWVGTSRLAGADTRVGVLTAGSNGFFVMNPSYYLSPEMAKLPAGEQLILKVYRLQGWGDFIIGTGGAWQTFVKIKGFTSDPLAGALYLQGGVLVADPSAVRPTEEPPSPASATPAWILPFLLLPARRRTASAMVVVGALLSGCLSSNSSDAAGASSRITQASIVQSQESRADLEAAGHGAIEGMIRDELGIGVKGAHVALPGTNVFADTNGRGEFRFPNVTAGRFLLRVDATGYPPLERHIEVEDGKVLRLTVYLVRYANANTNTEKHLHDYWQGKDHVALLDADILPASYLNLNADDDTYHCPASLTECPAIAYVDTGSIVPPGTTRVEVKVDLPDGLAPDHEAALQVATAGATRYFGFRTSGTPYKVAIFPHEADPGHRKFSQWTFTVKLRQTALLWTGTNGEQWYTSGGKLHIAATAFKGIVPYEAPHTDPWKTKTVVNVVNGPTITTSSFTPIDYPCEAYNCPTWQGSNVPPGTKELRGIFSWVGYQNGVAPLQGWQLFYKAADIPPGHWRDNLKPVTLVPNGTDRYDFTIPVQPGEEDPFYGGANWRFFADDGEQPIMVGTTPIAKAWAASYGEKVTLVVKAYKDPAFHL